MNPKKQQIIEEQQKPPFKEYIFQEFKDWEDQQPGGRSNYTAFANWLSQNAYGVTIKQQTITDWFKGRYKPNDEKIILVLVEKFGDEVYEILERSPIDTLFIYVQDNWSDAPLKEQKRIAEIIQKYSGTPLPNDAHKNSTAEQE